ncbi:MAG: response regulator transcription factor, partial [Verrucomicrobiales bacterium]
PMSNITVLLADDHLLFMEGLRKLLEADPRLEIVGEAHTGREAVDQAVRLRPQVIVMDVAMPQLNGLEATRQIVKVAPESRVLILSAYEDPTYVERAMEYGASGYLLKRSASEILILAIRTIRTGGGFFSPAIDNRLFGQDSPHGSPAFHVLARLTSRELEVLQLIAEGNANKQTAVELGISIKTVEKHRQHLMEKLAIHETAGLTRFAISAGIIESTTNADGSP